MRLGPEERERVFAAVADERRSIATMVEGLDEDQLATPSLCAGWDVKTVAAHLVSDFTDGFWGFLGSGLRHGSIDRGIDALARRRAQASAAEIAETLRSRDFLSCARACASGLSSRPRISSRFRPAAEVCSLS